MSYDMDKFLMIDKGNKEFETIKVNLRWQGLGGKRQFVTQGNFASGDYEHPTVAMHREFKEETESDKKFRWHCFHIKHYKGIKIYCFAAFTSPNEMQAILDKHKDNGFVTKEGMLGIFNLVDVYFEPDMFTFDTRYLIPMILWEMRKGFFMKFDPEGVNSSAPKT